MFFKEPKMKHGLRAALLGLALYWSAPAMAAEVTITAEYRSGVNFTNTTPQAAFCRRWPHYCVGIETVGLPITYEKQTEKNAPDTRDRFYIKLPGRRSLSVVNDQTGESYPLTFEMYAVSQYVNPHGGMANPIFTQVIGGGCSYRFTLGTGRGWAVYLWNVRVPESPTGCFSSGDFGGTGFIRNNTVNDMGVSYRLTAPSPLKMKQGTYRGQVTYTIGPGADFDFGNSVTNLNTNSLTVKFELDVKHAFVIDWPANSDRVVLGPPGGWSQWLNNQRTPDRLYRDLPMRIWSSGPFTVHTRCQYDEGGKCAIRNLGNDHQVPVEVALTLPNVIQHNGQSVTRLPIPVGEASALEFEATTQPAINRGGSLHFQVNKPAISEMTRYPGSRYEGDVTIVFDADF